MLYYGAKSEEGHVVTYAPHHYFGDEQGKFTEKVKYEKVDLPHDVDLDSMLKKVADSHSQKVRKFGSCWKSMIRCETKEMVDEVTNTIQVLLPREKVEKVYSEQRAHPQSQSLTDRLRAAQIIVVCDKLCMGYDDEKVVGCFDLKNSDSEVAMRQFGDRACRKSSGSVEKPPPFLMCFRGAAIDKIGDFDREFVKTESDIKGAVEFIKLFKNDELKEAEKYVSDKYPFARWDLQRPNDTKERDWTDEQRKTLQEKLQLLLRYHVEIHVDDRDYRPGLDEGFVRQGLIQLSSDYIRPADHPEFSLRHLRMLMKNLENISGT